MRLVVDLLLYDLLELAVVTYYARSNGRTSSGNR